MQESANKTLAAIAANSGMQLDDVAIEKLVLPADLLPIKTGLAPKARVPQRSRDIFVNEPRYIFHCLSLPHTDEASLHAKAGGAFAAA